MPERKTTTGAGSIVEGAKAVITVTLITTAGGTDVAQDTVVAAGSPHPSVQPSVVERGRGPVDLATRQAGVAQRVEVDDVVDLVDDLGDLPAHLVELSGLQPQLENGLLQPVPHPSSAAARRARRASEAMS